jgi:hypothetical protein
VHSARTPPADGDSQRSYADRAETYLRLLVEAALRPAANGDISAVRRAAEALTDAGVLSDQTAAEILADVYLALRVRGRRQTAAGTGSRLSKLRGFQPGSPFGQPGGEQAPWRVLPLGPPSAGSRLMALIRTAERALAPAVLQFPAAPIEPLDAEIGPLTTLTATDDLGTSYRIGFPDGIWAGSTWTGTISLYPAPSAAVRRLEISSPNGPVLRASLSAAPAGHLAPVLALEPVGESPGERVLTRRAEAMLAALARENPAARGARLPPDTDELAAILEGAGVLSPLSAAPARLATLAQLLGLPAERPASEIPARWTELVAYYGRRRRPAPVAGTAAIGVVLPALDGARFAVAGLHSGGPGTFLHVVAEGLRPMPRRPARGLPWAPGAPRALGSAWEAAPAVDAGFSWWVRDDAGGWHLGAIEEVNPVGGSEGLLRMSLLPPLGQCTAALSLEVSGPAQQVTAHLPVRW